MKGAHMRELLKPDYIFMNQRPKSASLDAALELISEKCSEYAGVRASELKKMFLKREKMDSTGFGEQLAIPHAKVKRLNNPMIAVFRFEEGIDWKSMDGQPVRVAIALIMPAGDENNTHLQVLAKLSRKLVHQEFMEMLLKIEDKKELYNYIIEEMGDLG